MFFIPDFLKYHMMEKSHFSLNSWDFNLLSSCSSSTNVNIIIVVTNFNYSNASFKVIISCNIIIIISQSKYHNHHQSLQNKHYHHQHLHHHRLPHQHYHNIKQIGLIDRRKDEQMTDKQSIYKRAWLQAAYHISVHIGG